MGAEPFRIADEVRTTVEAAGAGLEVSLYAGDAQASTIVFLHEGLGSVAMWRDFPGRVAAATGCPVMVY